MNTTTPCDSVAQARSRAASPFYLQLWFLVLLAMAAGIAFGRFYPDTGLWTAPLGERLHQGDPCADRACHLLHGHPRHRRESVALSLGIHRLMSPALTPTNLIGNGVATLVIAKWVGRCSRPPRMQQGLSGKDLAQR
jgi:Na+/H+-dicarboxylate symporter